MNELPNGWKLVDFPDLVLFQEGPGLRKYQYREAGIPFLNIRTFNDERIDKTLCGFLDPQEVDEKYQHFLVAEDDILVAVSGSIGKMAIAKSSDLPLMLNTSIMRFRPRDETVLLRGYLYFFLKSQHFFEQAEKAWTGTAQKNMGPSHIKTFKLLTPPLNEQRRIVAKLDSLFARSRRARKELERVAGLCDRYRQAVLAAAFRGDLTADWREGNSSKLLSENHILNANDLPSLPSEWIWTNVGQVAKVTGGLTKNQSRTNFEKKVPYLRVANVYANELRLDEISEIGVTETEWERVKLKVGDLLIVEGNGSLEQIGRVAIWHGEIEPCAHQNHLIKLRVKNFITPKFALYWLLSPGGRRAIEQVASSSAGLHTLSISKVSALHIPLCAVQEMEVVVERIEKLFKAIAQIESEHQKALKLCDRLDQAILTKAFSGELVPQDPTDEPADVLLDRIRAEKQDLPKSKKLKSKHNPATRSLPLNLGEDRL
jgi:type I restriction enzyme, S subunit